MYESQLGALRGTEVVQRRVFHQKEGKCDLKRKDPHT